MVLIRLRGYTGWSAPLLFAYTIVRVSLVDIYKPNYSDQFKKITKCYKKVGYNLNIMQHVCMPGLKPKLTMVSSLIARRWVRPPTQRRP